MIDFAISNNGDIMLSPIKQYPRLAIKFFTSQYPKFRLQFHQGQEQKIIEHPGCLKIRFNSKQRKINEGLSSQLLNSKEELKQRILLRLRTELGDIKKRPDYGSDIVSVRHLDINSADTQQKIIDTVYDQVSDIIDNPVIKAVPAICDGTFFCQNIDVYIYDGEELIYRFNVTG